jgi:hypothetical protein
MVEEKRKMQENETNYSKLCCKGKKKETGNKSKTSETALRFTKEERKRTKRTCCYERKRKEQNKKQEKKQSRIRTCNIKQKITTKVNWSCCPVMVPGYVFFLQEKELWDAKLRRTAQEPC